jgi:hypothetical protein
VRHAAPSIQFDTHLRAARAPTHPGTTDPRPAPAAAATARPDVRRLPLRRRSSSPASVPLLVLSTSQLGVRADFCFEGIASRELASKAAGLVGLSFAWRSGRLRPSSSTARGIRPIHRSGAAEMRAARRLPSWNIGQFVLAAEDGLSKRRLWPVPGGWLSLRCSSGGASGGQDLFRGAGGARERARGDYAAPGRAGSRSVVGIQLKCRRVRLRRATGARPEAQRRLRG